MKKEKDENLIAQNKKARHDYVHLTFIMKVTNSPKRFKF